MRKKIVTAIIVSMLTFSAQSQEIPMKKSPREKVKIALDWFINADHAPIYVAEEIGAFKEEGIDVDIIEPKENQIDLTSDVINHNIDLVISYQPSIYKSVEEGKPLVRVGTVINQPVDMIAALPSSHINTLKDLKGKTIGYASGDPKPFTLETMLATEGLSLNDIHLVNVGYKLVPALENKSVDAVFEVLRNIEGVELAYDTHTRPVEFHTENYGIPRFDELIVVANKNYVNEIKIAKFMQALKKGTEYLLAHPQKSWKKFAATHPEMNNEREHATWNASLQYFAHNPISLDKQRYISYRNFLYDHHQINKKLPISHYAIELKVTNK